MIRRKLSREFPVIFVAALVAFVALYVVPLLFC